MKKQRKQIVASKRIQGRILTRFCCLWLIYNLLSVCALATSAMLSLNPPRTFPELVGALWTQHFWAFAIIVAICPVVCYDILKTTHRIAGPLIRFEMALQQMAKDQPVQPVALRKHDLLVEFQKVFNEYIEHHNQQVNESAERDLTGHAEVVA